MTFFGYKNQRRRTDRRRRRKGRTEGAIGSMNENKEGT
jgi:hypothetical protein